MLISLIEDEIRYEKMLLQDIQSKISCAGDTILTFSGGSFHFREKNGNGKFRYIGKKDRDLLRNIAADRYRIEKARILETNISTLETVLKKLCDYDDLSVIDKMPKAHRTAVGLLRDTSFKEGVIQSENPRYRNGLVIEASDGLKLRTKGELNLYETLKSYGLNVRYEKKLILNEKQILPNGNIRNKEIEVYPDFTIIFPEGFRFFWELNGLYDDPAYRRDQFSKINLYYDNGIYMPKNLIVTMESADKPLNLVIIRRIIEAQLMPLMRKYT